MYIKKFRVYNKHHFNNSLSSETDMKKFFSHLFRHVDATFFLSSIDIALSCNYSRMTRKKKTKIGRAYIHAREQRDRGAQRSVAAGQTAAAKRHCPRVAAIVNQLARIVNKSPFYNSAAPRRTTSVWNLSSIFVRFALISGATPSSSDGGGRHAIRASVPLLPAQPSAFISTPRRIAKKAKILDMKSSAGDIKIAGKNWTYIYRAVIARARRIIIKRDLQTFNM